MTLSVRNNCFKAGIIVSALALVLIAASAYLAFPAYPDAAGESARRASGLFQGIASDLLEGNPYAPFISMLAAVFYSLISLTLIYYFFEKTQSPEIFYVALFVMSLAFEFLRIMVPLSIAMELSNIYLLWTSRVLVFGRYFGLFSLFAASICASGLEIQKQQNVIFVIIAAALIIALGIPIDGLSWDSSLAMLLGFPGMFIVVETGVLLITVASFLVSSYTRGVKEYVFVGLGTLLVYAGRNMLLHADTWAVLMPGLFILAAGTWFICTWLHKVYLWL
ncbi:hypothetical protein [Leadbettera azotonutricia]|uniref:Putative membrane protein n=1 Tax=Leadbettera azotonutricia (strain ATCC BAA-888 / DSM 13862 / ZAS-9) TaxID=545695 RepID=F5Y8Q2_LEAAZ|nr:hypothetical protein [Leadbettera azotonutricia]AEF82215.1 putative membrane protein [Leadbettera azotonutricia ZAS-9]